MHVNTHFNRCFPDQTIHLAQCYVSRIGQCLLFQQKDTKPLLHIYSDCIVYREKGHSFLVS